MYAGESACAAGESRAVTDALLAGLAAGRWRPAAWRDFLAQSSRRSAQQMAAHPRMVAELAALHGGFALIAGRRRRTWIACSVVLALTHVGMLGSRSSIGLANAITMIRANLPAIAAARPGWLGLAAIGSDVLDGALARRLGAETEFGRYADSLADAAFWIWFSADERNRTVRVAALAAWALPIVAVTSASFARGAMLEAPRPAILRPAAAMQAALALRALIRPSGRTLEA